MPITDRRRARSVASVRGSGAPWLVMTLALAILAGSGVAWGQSPSPDASPVTGGSPGASPSPFPTRPPFVPPDGAEPLPVEGGALDAGTYASVTAGPLVSFTIGGGWGAIPDVQGLGWGLLDLTQQAPAVMSFTPFTGDVFVDTCLAETDATVVIDVTAAAIIEDISLNPNLVAPPPTEVDVGGFPGLQLEVTPLDPMGCQPPVVWLWSIPGIGDFHLDAGEQARFIALDVAGAVLMISIEAFPGADYEAFLASAMDIVDSVEINPSWSRSG